MTNRPSDSQIPSNNFAAQAVLPGLYAVFARFQHAVPFSMDLFDGFQQLQALTYSSDARMTAQMCNRFDHIECVIGTPHVIHDLAQVFAFQQVVHKNLVTEINGLHQTSKHRLLQRVAEGTARFLVMRNGVSHAKLYLLNGVRPRIIVGSPNLSTRAFGGKQVEMVNVFEDDDAWNFYSSYYQAVRECASTFVPNFEQPVLPLDEVPLARDAEAAGDDGIVVLLGSSSEPELPVMREIERISLQLQPIIKAHAQAKNGKVTVTRQVIGQIIRTQRANRNSSSDSAQQCVLTVNHETSSVLHAGKALDLHPSLEDIRSDATLLIEYFENFARGFRGDVLRHQRDYWLFWAWLYFSPFICDLRNHAIVNSGFIFDYPICAVLYGKSNCGKTCLIQTLMQSMFDKKWTFVDRSEFTATKLQGLRATMRRFPIVFDDLDRKRFSDHANDLVKDETLIAEEYPAFILSMNAADNHSFPTEVTKRCLMIYTQASLPPNTDESRQLYSSVVTTQKRLGTALYRAYLCRVLDRLKTQQLPEDLVACSSQILLELLETAVDGPLPPYLQPLTRDDFQSRKDFKIKTTLRTMYETNPTIWQRRGDDVLLRVDVNEAFALRKEIPDYLLKEGGKAGVIVLDRALLETFMDVRFGSWWRHMFRR